ncbi:MAG: tonB dependent receptor family protein [Sphingomonadales bacterium]|nr:tonB dependent receptor family protein [Sphingomonadales bacterium]
MKTFDTIGHALHRAKALNTTASILAVMAMTCSGAAYAQSAKDLPQDTTSPAPTPGSNETAASVDEPSQDIVVTAQKRSERLRDVPISIVTLSAATLQATGARSTLDLTSVTPGLYMQQNGAFGQPAIRGVSSTVTSAGSDANVAIYIDGVYQPSQTGNLGDLVDVDQIEVLKGPQGTLFGRNATGGAISITTRKPSYDTHVETSASYGRFNDVRLTGYATSGLTDNLAFSVGALYGDDNGYTFNVGTGKNVSGAHSFVVRGKLLYEPSSSTSFTLMANHSKKRDNQGYAVSPLNGNFIRLTLPGVIVPKQPDEISMTFDPVIKSNSDSVALRGETDLGFGSLTSITSYQRRKGELHLDTDRINLNFGDFLLASDQKTFTQELNFVSPSGGSLRYFAGAFYLHDSDFEKVTINGSVTPIYNFVKTDAIAPFAEINWDVADKIMLIAGARYSIERKKFDGSSGPKTVSTSDTFRNFTPHLGVRYSLTGNSNVYFTYSKGFKSGLFDTLSLSTTPVAPEELSAFEGGYKFGRGSTNFNIAAYYYDYKNIQVQSLSPIGNGATVIFNAARGEIYGIDADFSVKPVSGLTLTGGISYVHAEYKDFPLALIYQPKPGGGNTQVNLGAVNPVTGVVNTSGASGQRIARMPRYTGSLTAMYRHALDNDNALEISSTGYYSGSFTWSPQGRLQQSPYFLLNGEIALLTHSDHFRLSVWGRNLTNERYGLYVTDSTAGDSAAYARPRTYGVAIATKF